MNGLLMALALPGVLAGAGVVGVVGVVGIWPLFDSVCLPSCR